jgi:hypothetical protein
MNSFKSALLPLILLFFLSEVSAEIPKSIQPENYRIGAKKIESQITIDGKLDEKDWGLATPASDFVQLEPKEGKPATEKTKVRVLYDEKNIYIGISCFDQSPEKIVANHMCRDADLDQNDFVGQTFRFAYLFPGLEARRDYRVKSGVQKFIFAISLKES